MIVGTCRLQLRLPANGSLKGKRQTVQSIVAHIRKDFNVAVAEVDTQDSWQLATLGIVTVSTAAFGKTPNKRNRAHICSIPCGSGARPGWRLDAGASAPELG